ncbi:MAG: dehydratase, partial [Anaerolineae bacterium]|nr:dehydratase [Anaerolineae bacterium]
TVLAFRAIEMKFSDAVYIGDTVHVEITIKETKEAARLGGGLVTFEVKIVNQSGKTVQKGDWVVLIASKPSA